MRTRSMNVKNNELYIGGVSLKDLAERYGTPLYVYDEMGIKDKIDTFKKYFKSDLFECEVVYASKAFLAPRICNILSDNDISIDAVSAGDMYVLDKSGYPMNKVVLHGNNKSNDELAMAIDYGVEYIVVDNYSELIRLNEIANMKKKIVHTLVRINPGIEAHTHAYIETSLLNSKFGESIHDIEILRKIVSIYQDSKYLVLDGFHAHIGSQITNQASFIALAKTMSNFVKMSGLDVHVLNLGGGYAIKYLDSDDEISLKEVLPKIIEIVATSLADSDVVIDKLMIEPGRSLVGDSGVTLYHCGGFKTTFGGKKYLFIDGGMADNIRPALYGAKYTVEVANRVSSNSLSKYDVVGKCCESGDVIASDVEIGEVHKKDIIIVYATGAYCYSMSMNYNGLIRGGVVFVDGDKVHEVIKRQSFEDLASTYVFEEKE